jgi:Tol biopolymer transport system component
VCRQVEGGPAWNHLWEIFHAVRDASPVARDEVLERLCCDDDDLKAEVAQLLEADQVTGSPLDRAPLLVPADGPAPPERFTPGTLLCDRFEIIARIGQGGMGSVYEATDRSLGGRIALKMLLPRDAGDERARRRFFREIDLARQVTHPNVCRLFDLYEHYDSGSDDGIALVTMELLRGETLLERIERGPLPADEALEIAQQIAAGLDAAHACGIVHRDLKPGNVIITRGEEGVLRVVITDFGIALRPSRTAPSDAPVTRTGQLFGTPAYMAPEQFLEQEISPATDLYSFGILLCEMITGAAPFRDDSPFDLALKRLHGSLPSPREVMPTIDPRWERTILRCLERDPRDRFRSASEVVAALEGDRVAAVPAIRRLRLPRAAVAVAILGATAALVGAAFLRNDRPPGVMPEAGGDLTFRRVWNEDAGVGLMGTTSRDGRLLSYVDWTTGDLALRDLVQGTSRLLTDKGPWTVSREYTEYSAVSPDGRRVAYAWSIPGGFQLRSIDTDLSNPRLLLSQKGLVYVAPFQWTSDGQSVLALISYPQNISQIVLVSAETGALTVLKSWNSRSAPTAIGISADGRFVAYDLITEGSRDLFLLSIADRSEQRVEQHPADDRFLDWTPDGRHLLFLSNRGSREGDFGMFLLPVTEGGRRGDPRRIRERLGMIHPAGFTSDGRYFYATNSRTVDVFEASPSAGQPGALKEPRLVDARLQGKTDAPAYSRDGRLLAYLAGGAIEIRTDGEAPRSITSDMSRIYRLSRLEWWPDGQSLLVAGIDRDGVGGVHRLDVESGLTEPLVSSDSGEHLEQPVVSPDAMTLYYVSRGASDGRAHEIRGRDLRSETTRAVVRASPDEVKRFDLSPDGRMIAFIRQRHDTHTIEVVAAAGGSPREVFRFEQPLPRVPPGVAWGADSRMLLFTRNDSEIWSVDTETRSAARLMAVDAPVLHLTVDPVQERVAWSVVDSRNELWVLEHLGEDIRRHPTP